MSDERITELRAKAAGLEAEAKAIEYARAAQEAAQPPVTSEAAPAPAATAVPAEVEALGAEQTPVPTLAELEALGTEKLAKVDPEVVNAALLRGV